MKVAVAVIFDTNNLVLITRRPSHAPHGGLWEFPGGKLEAEEPPVSALIREIKEEVDLEILEYRFLGEVIHNYGSKEVNLLIFRVDHYLGNPRCCESQMDLQWVSIENLADYEFPEANFKIIELIKASVAIA